ncbi:MAG TPA: hypothetical protein P5218_16225, partial [Planctomycetota bacterium]|nr:hypothetical protein [Planctomycetota bacterium]
MRIDSTLLSVAATPFRGLGRRASVLGLALLAAGSQPASLLAQDGVDVVSREQAALAEEQALIARQIKRLRGVMSALEQRLRTEGRVHAAGLLAEALKELEEREGDAGATLEEQVNLSSDGLRTGSTMRAIEDQQAALRRMERLLEVLLDRKRVEDLEQELQQLGELKQGLSDAQNEQRQLSEETRALGQESQSAEQKALQKELAQMVAKQQALLAQVEQNARETGAFDLERIAEELAQSIADQQLNLDALGAWKPMASEGQPAAREALAKARRNES